MTGSAFQYSSEQKVECVFILMSKPKKKEWFLHMVIIGSKILGSYDVKGLLMWDILLYELVSVISDKK